MPTLLLAILLTAAAPQVEVQTLDGQTLRGTIAQLDAQTLSLQTADRPVSVAVEKLLYVALQEKPAATIGDAVIGVELLDGSSLAATQYVAADGRAQVSLRDGQVLEVPTGNVATVRLQKLSPAATDQWSRIVEMKTDSDLLVVGKSEAVDYHRGVLRNISDTVVDFELDGSNLPVKRSKVLGLVYHHAPGDSLPESICRITDTAGSHWSAAKIALGDQLEWTTPGGLKVAAPLQQIVRLDFSQGKIVFLSDLQPESVVFTPYFGSAEAVPLLAELYAPRSDKNQNSEPLQLDGRQYAKGLSLHSRTRAVYRLPGRFQRFKATVGIDDGVRPQGNVKLAIYGDDRILLQTDVRGAEPSQPVDLEIDGVRRIAILVDFGEEMDVADHLDLCEARLIK